MATRGRVRGGSRRRVSSRRKYIWARHSGSAIVAAGTGAGSGFTTDLLDEFKTRYGADAVGCTVVRIRGQIIWDQGPVASSEPQNAVVAARVATEPFGTGEERPLDVPHADWFMYQPILTFNHPTDTSNWKLYRAEVDVRANRKLEELAQGLLLAAQHDSVSVAAGMAWNLSIGLKLP